MTHSLQILYGLSFDLQVTESVNTDNSNNALYDNDCWNSSLLLRIENGLSSELFDAAYAERESLNSSSYGGSDSKSWLISLAQSLMLSLILWQPLTYVSFHYILETYSYSSPVTFCKGCTWSLGSRYGCLPGIWRSACAKYVRSRIHFTE